jgi:hypothetical protein
MASTSETGHAKNVANFEDLISFCTGYGAQYNPSNPTLTLTALNTLFTNAKASLDTLNTTRVPWVIAVNAREIAFKPLSPLVTRVINALDSTEASAEIVADAKTISRKIQGSRSSKTVTTTPPDPNNPAPDPKTVSASQMSYDSRIENLQKLVKLLAAQPEYTPNETELSVATLDTLHSNLTTLNSAAVNTYTSVSNSRIARNNSLYSPVTGLVDIAGSVKKYVKSVFGASSPQYKQISGLQFRIVKE